MSLNWKSIRAEHVTTACETLLSGANAPRSTAKGIFVTFQGEKLPAKQVLRLAYCLANNMSLTSKIKFSSGDGTISLLVSLGFEASRNDPQATA
jgi:hypothetical protein